MQYIKSLAIVPLFLSTLNFGLVAAQNISNSTGTERNNLIVQSVALYTSTTPSQLSNGTYNSTAFASSAALAMDATMTAVFDFNLTLLIPCNNPYVNNTDPADFVCQYVNPSSGGLVANAVTDNGELQSLDALAAVGVDDTFLAELPTIFASLSLMLVQYNSTAVCVRIVDTDVEESEFSTALIITPPNGTLPQVAYEAFGLLGVTNDPNVIEVACRSMDYTTYWQNISTLNISNPNASSTASTSNSTSGASSSNWRISQISSREGSLIAAFFAMIVAASIF